MGIVLERLTEAQNAHDVDRLVSLFAADHRSEQPTQPSLAFTGPEQVRANWTAFFAGIPDFRAELVATCSDGSGEWGEVHWHGHHTDGSPFAMRGVIIATIREEQIAAARLYVGEVALDHVDIDTRVEELTRPRTPTD